MTPELPAPADAQSLTAGEVIDRKYRIEKPLGQGGMGSVYLATHEGTERAVALKLIRSSLLLNQEVIRRFKREAKTLGRLRHPNIVNIIDYGTTMSGGTEFSYLVMEYLEGLTLRQFLDAHGVLPLATVVDVTEQVAAAVTAAHKVGIVHRDLKPDNVWLIANARGGIDVKVLDFGIAKVLEQSIASAAGAAARHSIDTDQDDMPIDTTLREAGEETVVNYAEATETVLATGSSTTLVTGWGTTIGTPNYMSPEQCRGDLTGPVSDIYSMGVIAFECLSGTRPFSGSFIDLLRKHQYERPPRLDEINKKISSPVADCIDRAVAKQPSARFPSATAFAGTLRVASNTPSVLLRRAAAIYAERFDTLSRLAFKAALPAAPLFCILVALAIWHVATDGGRFMFEDLPAPWSVAPIAMAALISISCWVIGAAAIRTAIAHAFDDLRHRPLAPLDSRDVLAAVAARFGRRRYGMKVVLKLAATFARHQFGTGVFRTPVDLSHMVALAENRTYSSALQRARELWVTSRKSYEFISAGLAATFVIPIMISSVIYNVALVVGLTLPEGSGFWMFFILLPLTCPLTEPLSALGILLFYYGARQANGEDIS